MKDEELARRIFHVLDNALIYAGKQGGVDHTYIIHPMFRGTGGMTGIVAALVRAVKEEQ
jgi:RimJ/RimL family protein N-acetyltransferase